MRSLGAALGLMVLLLLSVGLQAQSPDAIVGKWLNGEKSAQVEIYKGSDGKYFGKIVWLKEPVYPADDNMGMAGKPKVDRLNPDPAKRTQPTLGLTLLRNFVHSGGNLWDSGMIYDPKNGKDYRCKMTLTSPDVLNVRGYIGISLIGRTDVWTRVK